MAALILPRRFDRQPQAAAEVDWSHPLLSRSRGRASIWIPSRANLVTASTAVSTVATDRGIAHDYNGSTSYHTVDAPWAFDSTVGATMFALIRSDLSPTGAATRQVMSRTNTTGQAIGAFSFDHTNVSFRQAWAVNSSGTWRALKYTTSLTAGTWYLVAISRSSAGTKAYLDGRLEVTDAGANGTLASATSNLSIGSGLSNGVTALSFFDGRIALAGEIPVIWSDSEHAAFAANPWQLFHRPPLRLFISQSGFSGTINLDSISFGISANDSSPSLSMSLGSVDVSVSAENAIPSVEMSLDPIGVGIVIEDVNPELTMTIDPLQVGVGLEDIDFIVPNQIALESIAVDLNSNPIDLPLTLTLSDLVLNEIIYEKLGGLGFTGALNERMIAYWQNGGAASNDFNTAFKEWLILQVGTFKTYNNTWFDYLEGLGYEGSLNDKEKAYWYNL